MGTRTEEVPDQPVERDEDQFEVDPEEIVGVLRSGREQALFQVDMLNIGLKNLREQLKDAQKREQQLLLRIAELEDGQES